MAAAVPTVVAVGGTLRQQRRSRSRVPGRGPLVLASAAAPEFEIRFCTHKKCKSQGAQQVGARHACQG